MGSQKQAELRFLGVIVMNSVILFEIPRFTFVLFMFCIACEQLKVIYSIVSDIMVDVMDYLRTGKGAPQVLSHNKTMLHNVTITSSHAYELSRAADVLDARRVLTFTAAKSYTALPRWIISAAHSALHSLLMCCWLSQELRRHNTKHTFGFPNSIAKPRTEIMIDFLAPCFRFAVWLFAVVADYVIGALDRLTVALLRTKALLARQDFLAASLTGLMGYRIHTPIITYVL